jgi:hypothetical protein
MKSEKEWETKSLEWIHKVRQKIDEEIKKKGMTPAQWIKARGKIDVEQLCHKMGIKNVTIIREEPFSRLKKVKQY